MPKRQCPFDLTYLPQLKAHIGQKEFDLKHEENMSKIYDKTLQLLFNGTKQLYKVNGNAAKIRNVELENHCILKNVSEQCKMCNKLNVENKCYFCDKWTCHECCSVCCKCCQKFCIAHVLKLYNENDGCICLNCYQTNS